MYFELVFAFFVGLVFGTFTGIFPGVHINLVAAGLLALISRGFFSGLPSIALAVFVVAMAVTHTFVDFVPSIFLGAPEEESFLAVLPGHEMLKKGRGFEAVATTIYGCLAAIPFLLLFSLLFIEFLPGFYDYFRIALPFVLIFVSLYFVLREENFLTAFLIFIFAGVLGLLTFNLPVKEPLTPLLTGMFGVSSLIASVKGKISIPQQRVFSFWKMRFDRSFLKSFLAGGLIAPFFSFLPAIGSGQAAAAVSEISRNDEKDPSKFLFLVGMINLLVIGLSFVTLFAIDKGRTGAAVAVGEIMKNFSVKELTILLFFFILASVCAFFISLTAARFFARNISKISYSKISFSIIVLLLFVNIILSNYYGLIILVAASALGVFCIFSGVRRVNLMGCLIIPTIIYYLIL